MENRRFESENDDILCEVTERIENEYYSSIGRPIPNDETENNEMCEAIDKDENEDFINSGFIDELLNDPRHINMSTGDEMGAFMEIERVLPENDGFITENEDVISADRAIDDFLLQLDQTEKIDFTVEEMELASELERAGCGNLNGPTDSLNDILMLLNNGGRMDCAWEEKDAANVLMDNENSSENRDVNRDESDEVQIDIDQTGGGSSLLFKVIEESTHRYRRFNMFGTNYSLEVFMPAQGFVAEIWVRDLLSGIISYFKNNSEVSVRPGDYVSLSFRNNIFDENPLYMSLVRADQLVPDLIFKRIMQVYGSNKEFFINGYLEAIFDHIRMPHGAGRIARSFGQTNADFILNKCSFMKYTIPKARKYNKYRTLGYCLPFALVIAKAFAEYSIHDKSTRKVNHYKKYQKGFKCLISAAKEMCKEAKVTINSWGCSLDEVKKFQEILPDYQIVIYGGKSKSPVYYDAAYTGKRTLCIMLHQNHYTAMRNVQGCFGGKYLCPDCHSHATLKSKHKCKYACTQCFAKPKCSTVEPLIACKQCNRSFYGVECFTNHMEPQGDSEEAVCDSKRKCFKCFSPYEKDHVCGKKMCRTCEKIVEKLDHKCHMAKYVTKRDVNTQFLNIYFDLETQQNTLLNSSDSTKFKHIPNLCVTQSICCECDMSRNISDPCHFCGQKRENIFHSENCVEQLMDYIAEKENEQKTRKVNRKDRTVAKYEYITVFAHNLKGFDGQFILKYIYESDRFPNPGLIMNGTKIIQITLGRVRFIDSINYFQEPLSKLPGLCGFQGSKGYYPHFFNSPENNEYKGRLPEKKYYGYDQMIVKSREKFDQWYDSLPSDYVFDNKKELVEYCRMDVEILRKACEIFRHNFWHENGIEPFIDACTIAGACNRVFRSNYLKEDTI